MSLNKKLIPLLLALLGCLGLIFFFQITASLRAVKLLKPAHAAPEFLARANTAFEKSALAEFDLERKTSIELNRSLFAYAQTKFGGELPAAFYPIGHWRVEWRGEVETKKEGKQPAYFIVEYDFTGRLIHHEQSAPDLRKSRSMKEWDAIRKALLYLHRQEVDTTNLELLTNVGSKDNRLLQYEFTFSKPSPISSDLRESYDLKIAGRNVVNYHATVDFYSDSGMTIEPISDRSSDSIFKVLAVAVWFLIVMLAIIRLLKKIKHDELEFKRGMQFGFVCLALVWGAIAMSKWGSWTEVVFGGAIGGIFSAFALGLIYAVTDSTVRDVWPKKLELLDVLWRGFWRVKELGAGILKSLLLAGLTLFLIGISFWLVEYFGIGYLEFQEESFELFKHKAASVSSILDSLVTAGFVGLLLFLFWTSYLKSRVKNWRILLITQAVFINLIGLHLLNVQPTQVSFFLVLPLAFVWAYASLEFDIITILVALVIVGFGLDLVLLPAMGDNAYNLSALIFSGFIAVIYASGGFFWFSKRSVRDFEHYVPSYVSRIAERERVLQELEIARHVQKRFLPQSVPDFPGLEIGCVCQPATEVGGDYYDFIQNGRSSLGVVIGDVSGKGVSAAFYMTLVKGILKTLVRATSRPKSILSEMNAIFYENVPSSVFVSIMYGNFDLDKKVLKFARAGHNPLVVFRDGSLCAESILPKGLAIGLDEGDIFRETIEEMEIPFKANDVFVFFTDGISEATNRVGDEFGEARLHDVIKTCQKLSAHEMAKTIHEEVNQFAATATPHDDLTMVVVKIGDVAAKF